MNEPEPQRRTFGTAIRAYRNGWRWSKFHECYVRIEELSNKLILELAPASGPDNVKTSSGLCVAWWDDPNVLYMIPLMELIRNQHKTVTEYERHVLDDDGEVVKP